MYNKKNYTIWLVLLVITLAVVACGTTAEVERTPGAETGSAEGAPAATHSPLEPTFAAMIAARRSAEVPDLPFPDNPDPSQCGIPSEWGAAGGGWLDGRYQGELVQPTVFLYDSHLRLDVTAQATHGSEVEILLYQHNPVTDYYLVKIKGAEPPNQGWVPGPFLSFEPVPANS